MTKSYKKRRNKKILALLLSSFMAVTAATSLAACGSGEDSSSTDTDVTDSETDTARISNGSFEFLDDNKGKNLIITSPTGWSKSTGSSAQGSASSSKTASGIVDTSDDAWKNLTTSSGLAHDTEAEAKANWDKLTAKDRLEFYKTWEDADDDNKLSDLSFYDADKYNYNIGIDDVPVNSENAPLENPLTHDYTTENADDEDRDTHVLMLHNSYSDGRGTAQKYTSSTTITIQPGTSAQFSVWVKTMDMTFNGTSDGKGSPVISDRGAYIGITHTVGGTTLDQVQVKNIDTQAVNPEGENNGWVQYNFYLKGCSYASSTFTVVLGLGQGGGTDKWEYVDGYAFFDDVECSVVSNDDYDDKIDSLVSAGKLDKNDIIGIFTETNDRLFCADKEYKDVFDYALDLHSAFDKYSLDGKVTTDLTEEKSGNNKVYVSGKLSTESAPSDGRELYGQVNRQTDNDLTGLYTLSELQTMAGNGQKYSPYLKKILDNDFSGDNAYPFDQGFDGNVLLLMSTDGAAYTAKLEDESTFTLAPEQRLLFSFWLKTSDISGFTGASVTLHETEGTNETALSSLDTTSITTIDIDKYNAETGETETEEDIYKGWQQCFFFVENDTETDKSFTLSFSYGPTAIVGTTNSQYYAGYAAFTNFETYKLTEKEFTYASTGTYAKSVSLTGDELNSTASFDTASSIPDKQIETGIADPRNYKGVFGGSGYVVSGGTNNEINANEYAGLLNKKYAANYLEEMNEAEDKENHWLYKLLNAAGIAVGDTNADTWWNELFGTSTQPLVIYNNETQAYGYIGSSQTISSSSYATVSVKVKVGAGATANIYLVDTSEKVYDSYLSVNTLAYTYWYDDSGNVCDMDPSDKKFDKKKNVAFYLNEDNGLYEVNKNWQHYDSSLDGKYFANLSNYEKDDEGNLIVADGGVSYNYDASKWKNDGNDGIAFYCKDNKYYAYSDYKTEVTDFTAVEKLPARYTNVKADGTQGDARNLLMTVGNTQGEWITCTFYIHTGSAEKQYRLEVWSGTRDGSVKSTQNSFVAFDSVAPDSVDSSYADLVNETIEAIKTKNNWTDTQLKENCTDISYYTYSFYDSPEFLRYDSTLDKDEIGNKYTSYASSAYSEGVVYLYYEDSAQVTGNTLYTMFVDYSYTDVSVTADTTTDDSTDDTDDEETDQTNWLLLVSSLVLAIALIVAVIGLIVQKFVKKAHIKKARAAASNATSLNTAKRRYSKKSEKGDKKAESAPEKEEPRDEKDPYND